MVALSQIDANHDYNTRVKTVATNITAKGFYINVNTWYDSKIYGTIVSWIAFGK